MLGYREDVVLLFDLQCPKQGLGNDVPKGHNNKTKCKCVRYWGWPDGALNEGPLAFFNAHQQFTQVTVY